MTDGPLLYGNWQHRTDQVELKYFVKVLRELIDAGNHHTAKLMLDEVRIDDRYATWERTTL